MSAKDIISKPRRKKQSSINSIELGELYIDPRTYEKIVSDISKEVFGRITNYLNQKLELIGVNPKILDKFSTSGFQATELKKTLSGLQKPQKHPEISDEKSEEEIQIPKEIKGKKYNRTESANKLSVSTPKFIKLEKMAGVTSEKVRNEVLYTVEQIEKIRAEKEFLEKFGVRRKRRGYPRRGLGYKEKTVEEGVVKKGETHRTASNGTEFKLGSDVRVMRGADAVASMLLDKTGRHLEPFLKAYEKMEPEKKKKEANFTTLYTMLENIGFSDPHTDKFYEAILLIPPEKEKYKDYVDYFLKMSYKIFIHQWKEGIYKFSRSFIERYTREKTSKTKVNFSDIIDEAEQDVYRPI